MYRIILFLILWSTVACSSKRGVYNECQDAMVKLQTGRIQEAVTEVTAIINQHPDYLSAYLVRAQCNTSLKNYSQTKADCDIILGLNPEEGLAYYLRAEAYQNMGNLQEALQDYNEAIKRCHTGWQSELYLRRGIIRYQLGDKLGACTDWKVTKDQYHNPHLLPAQAQEICN